MNATLLSEVLLGIASKSRFSQGLDIEFKTSGGYKCSTHKMVEYTFTYRSMKLFD